MRALAGRALLLLASAFILLAPQAASSAEGSSGPKVLLSDFGANASPSQTLVRALRAHEERRLEPEARLRGDAPDEGWAMAVLEAARAIDPGSK